MIMKQEFDLLITSMITDRIGRHEILLQINQNYDIIQEKNRPSVMRFPRKTTVNLVKCATSAHMMRIVK